MNVYLVVNIVPMEGERDRVINRGYVEAEGVDDAIAFLHLDRCPRKGDLYCLTDDTCVRLQLLQKLHWFQP